MSRRSGTLFWLPLILGADDLDAVSTLLLVGLADHVNGEDACYAGIDTLASGARTSYATARRRLADLERSGHITRSRRRRADGNLSVYDYVLNRAAFGAPPLNVSDGPPLNHVSDDHRSPRSAMTTAHPGERAKEPPRDEPPRDEPLPDADASGAEEPARVDRYAEAKAIVDPWWEERRDAGNPVGQPYIAVVKIIHGMLANGTPANRLAFGVRAAPVVSAGAIEFAIQKELERRGERTTEPNLTARERRLLASGNAAAYAEAVGMLPARPELTEGEP